MKSIIETQRNGYGFGYDWTLNVETSDGNKKSFILGQDAKFCIRVLGLEPNDVVREIGDNDLRKEENRIKLAEFICNELNVNDETVNNLEPWSLCCQ